MSMDSGLTLATLLSDVKITKAYPVWPVAKVSPSKSGSPTFSRKSNT